MNITASIISRYNEHTATVATENNFKQLSIPVKASGYGSSANGGELLFLALATCFCNDIYREATKRNIQVNSVEVVVSGEFGKEGEPGFNISYTTKVQAPACTAKEIDDLIKYVDSIAEVHNTLRVGTEVVLKQKE